MAKTYYEILGITPDVSKEEIRELYNEWKATVWDTKTNEEKRELYNAYLNIRKAVEVLTNDSLREEYDKSLGITKGNEPKQKETEEEIIVESQKPVKKPRKQKVVKQEEAKETSKKGRKIIKTTATVAVVAAVLFCAAVGLGAIITKYEEKVANRDNDKETVNESTAYNPSDKYKDTPEDTNIEEPNIEEIECAPEMVPIVESVDIPKIYSDVASMKIDNQAYAPSISSYEDIEALVNWVQTADSSIDPINGYYLLKELASYKEKYDISKLFVGTDAYNRVNKVYTALAGINTENNNLDDEYNALMTIQEVLPNENDLSIDRNPELAAYFALLEIYTRENNGTLVIASGAKEGGNVYGSNPTSDYISGDNSYAKLQSTLTQEQINQCSYVNNQLIEQFFNYASPYLTGEIRTRG